MTDRTLLPSEGAAGAPERPDRLAGADHADRADCAGGAYQPAPVQPSPWRPWRRHFEDHASRPLPEFPEQFVEVPTGWWTPLAESLAKFQLGESGEGRIAHEVGQVSLSGVDDDYRQALRLFVQEEGRHSRILALAVRALGGTLLRKTWSERLFVRARRLLGYRFKVLVLLGAEVIGVGFYGAIAGALPSGALRAALEQICDDESAHLQFHAAFLGEQAAAVARGTLLFRIAWWSVGIAAAAVVLFDHRRTLAVLDVPLLHTTARLFELLARTDHLVTLRRDTTYEPIHRRPALAVLAGEYGGAP